jgi:hypothetical protein
MKSLKPQTLKPRRHRTEAKESLHGANLSDAPTTANLHPDEAQSETNLQERKHVET